MDEWRKRHPGKDGGGGSKCPIHVDIEWTAEMESSVYVGKHVYACACACVCAVCVCVCCVMLDTERHSSAINAYRKG